MAKSYVVRERPDGSRYFDENTPAGNISPDLLGTGLQFDSDNKLTLDADALAGDGLVSTGDTLAVDFDVFAKKYVTLTSSETVFGEKTFMNKIIAPTPAVTSNNNDVATTAFVRKHTEPDLSAERKVGTVFDTPVYEKTFSFVTPNKTWEDTEVIDLSGLNIDEVVSLTSSLRDTSQAFVSVPYATAERSIAVTGYVYQKKSYRVTVFEDSFLIRKGYVTIRYTKNS